MNSNNQNSINSSLPEKIPALSVTGLSTPLGNGGLDNVSFVLNKGEHLLITGTSGSGKTTLAKAIAGKIFYRGSVEFCVQQPKTVLTEQHYFFKTLSNTADFYYQQRYNSPGCNDAQTVNEELLKITDDADITGNLLNQLNLAYRRHDLLLHLSSGEHKRFQLIKTFLQDAGFFIFDSPFTGLDINSRKILRKLIDEKSSSSTIIIIADIEEAPSCITNILELENGKLKSFKSAQPSEHSTLNSKHSTNNIPRLPDGQRYLKFTGKIPLQKNINEFDIAVKLENVSVVYGNKKILTNVNWQINRGEKWLLKGINGAGKSTLISLITGDHPQVYANKVFLFDKKRGSGESIWDIKKRIGFVSPELHWYFDKTISVYNTIASGFYDTIGVYKKINAEQSESVQQWLSFLNLTAKSQFSLSALSTSQQRLVLLARALVKNPSLLILDEPCQGLDEQQVNDFVALVDALCMQPNKTLIYVSHYENEIPRCVDSVMLLEGGNEKKYSINIKKETAVAV